MKTNQTESILFSLFGGIVAILAAFMITITLYLIENPNAMR